ncbi:MAG: nicotinate-nucleotide adenylyltransferase [Pseudomonadota bacterium]
MEGFPPARPGRAIGLLGGSFDPPHGGHVHITLEALKRFGLDEIWWLVTPGNPLKSKGPQPLARRVAAARAVMRHPKVRITDVEARLGTRYTAATVDGLRAIYPGTAFVWLMGADNLAAFHHWDRWQDIMESVPVGILARPGYRIAARTSRAAAIFRRSRLKRSQAQLLAQRAAPAWCFLNVPMVDMSSTALRDRGAW